MVYIVGLGPGSREYILKKAEDTLLNSDLIVGFERALNSLSFIDKKMIKVKTLKEILNIIETSDETLNISVVASGDPLFYGISNYINKNSTKEIKIIPGISSFQYLMCKINTPWNNAYTGSLHGREDEFIEKVKSNEISIWLCDNKNSPSFLCENLINHNVDCSVTVGENLSYEDERIVTGDPKEIKELVFNNLSIIVVHRKL